MTRRKHTGLGAALAALALLAGVAPAPAQEPAGREKDARTRLKAVEADMAAARKRQAQLEGEARKLAAEIGELERQMVALARDIQTRERTLSRSEERLKVLTAERDAQAQALGKGQRDTAQLLAALQTMSRRPQALMFLRPASAAETVRSANVMKAVLPALQDRTAALRRQVEDLNATQAALAAEQETYRTELASLSEDRKKLEALRAEREAQRKGVLAKAEDENARLRRMAEEARDIQDLLAKLEAEARQRERFAALPGPKPRPAGLAEQVRAARSKGSEAAPSRRETKESSPTVAMTPPANLRAGFRMPVAGSIVQRFGAATRGGGSSKGILIRTRGEAQVVAPSEGRVVFAGPFRGYGQLLIIAHGNGYHSLLAGMARIDEKVGANVQAGSPVGVMGATEQGDPELYLELRQRGTPVDPMPWLSGKRGNTAG